MSKVITIIGGGNMGGAIATRWRAATLHAIHVIELNEQRRAALETQGMTAHASLADAPRSDIYLLAIKPQQFAGYVDELHTVFNGAKPLLISIMAGTPLKDLQQLSPNAVRVMPNLPATIGESMSALYAPALDTALHQQVSELFNHIGSVAWVEEEAQLHAVTAISGSGPGYVFAFMEALEKAAQAQGLSPSLARQLVTQTLKGAALLADTSTENAATLRAQVTSKGGTTEAALQVFAAGDLETLVARAAAAAAKRSEELAK